VGLELGFVEVKVDSLCAPGNDETDGDGADNGEYED